jgi:hypothetical protein
MYSICPGQDHKPEQRQTCPSSLNSWPKTTPV